MSQSKTDTQHFDLPGIDDALKILRCASLPGYDVVLDRIAYLEAEVNRLNQENKQLEADIEKIRRRMGASSR